MPKAKFTITGDIAEFDRVDNAYKAIKREGSKLMRNWIMTVNVEYEEKEGEKQ